MCIVQYLIIYAKLLKMVIFFINWLYPATINYRHFASLHNFKLNLTIIIPLKILILNMVLFIPFLNLIFVFISFLSTKTISLFALVNENNTG